MNVIENSNLTFRFPLKVMAGDTIEISAKAFYNMDIGI